MLRIAVSGGIGAGKSTVTAVLAELGAVVVDADAIAREVMSPGTPAVAAIASRFGGDLIDSNGQVRRDRLAQIVFGDATARADLEAITHPEIAALASHRLGEAAQAGIAVYDVPLLDDTVAERFDMVVNVAVDASTRLHRLIELRGMDPVDAQRRVSIQGDDTARNARSHYIVRNDRAVSAVDHAVRLWWHHCVQPADANLVAAVSCSASQHANWAAHCDELIVDQAQERTRQRVAGSGLSDTPRHDATGLVRGHSVLPGSALLRSACLVLEPRGPREQHADNDCDSDVRYRSVIPGVTGEFRAQP